VDALLARADSVPARAAPPAPPAAVRGGLLNIPNLITIARLIMVPLIVVMIGQERWGLAFVLFAAAGVSDAVDGYIARRFNQVSTLGKILDPAADRLLLGVAVVCILIDGSVPAIVAWPVIVRELLVSGVVLALAAMGARRIDVTFVGKAGTFALMTAFPLFLFGNDDAFPGHDGIRVAAWIVAAVGLALSYYAAARYVPTARQALAEARVKKGTRAAG
jgi:cardiolipin synthase